MLANDPTPKPGEVFECDRAIDGRRYVVVVSRELLNRGESVVTVPITAENVDLRKNFSNCVFLPVSDFSWLSEDSVTQAEQIGVTLKSEIVGGPIGSIDDETFCDLIQSIAYMLDASVWPN